MVQVNKDERVWVCFEMARVQTAHAVQRPLACQKTSAILAIRKNYRKYRKHGTRHKNKVNSGRYL